VSNRASRNKRRRYKARRRALGPSAWARMRLTERLLREAKRAEEASAKRKARELVAVPKDSRAREYQERQHLINHAVFDMAKRVKEREERRARLDHEIAVAWDNEPMTSVTWSRTSGRQ
jgi:hypothetical protein